SELNSSYFFNVSLTICMYTLSLHDALPIYLGSIFNDDLSSWSRTDLLAFPFLFMKILHPPSSLILKRVVREHAFLMPCVQSGGLDRKSTRLNSSHVEISYAVFCLKKKNRNT